MGCGHWLAGVLMLAPGLAEAQTLGGAAEWTVASGKDTSSSQTASNQSFWQNYTVNFGSSLVDPRLMKYEAGVSLRTNQLRFGSDQDPQKGGQRTLGYNVTASLFPARPFPLSVQMSRDTVAESGQLPTSTIVRGGIVVPTGQPLPDFQTRNTALAVNWQLTTGRLPHVDLGYRKSSSMTTGEGYAAGERDGEMHLVLSKDTTATRQTLRLQQTSFEHLIAQAFNQHFDELGYEFNALIAHRSRFVAQAGRRNSFSLFDPLPQIVDPGAGIAQPPSRGHSDTAYAISGVTFEPNGRVSFGVTGSLDQLQAETITTSSRLITTTARLEPFGGLSVSASGVYGSRGQIVGDQPLTVQTRTAQAGASYRAGVRWLEGTVGGTRRIGENTSPDGRTGPVQSWSGDTSLSVSAGRVSASGGYDRQHGDDAILDYGNFDIRRRRASLQVSGKHFSMTGTWDQSTSDRGVGITFVRAWQDTYSAALALRRGDSFIAASGGGYDNRTIVGHDRTYFGGVTYEHRRGRWLLSALLREELTAVFQNHLRQWNLVGSVKAEYMRRQFSLGIEYRRSAQDLQMAELLAPAQFRGRQLVVRISRKFGVRL